jgi:hypothetical protein
MGREHPPKKISAGCYRANGFDRIEAAIALA